MPEAEVSIRPHPEERACYVHSTISDSRARVSKDGAAPCFETHRSAPYWWRLRALGCAAMLLSMRPGKSGDRVAPLRLDQLLGALDHRLRRRIELCHQLLHALA